MISFIIPAHDEERWIGHCIGSIQPAMAAIGEPYEIVVVDDASSDATAQIAEQMAARVVRVELRNISAVRNASAAAASGAIFFFIDADTQANEHAIRAALE